MEEVSMKACDLIEMIEKAFGSIAYPGDDRLFRGINIDDPELSAVFRGLHWRELSLKLILEHKMSITYFTVDAFIFYLPAFMIQIIRNPVETEEEEIRSDLVHYLTPLTKKRVKLMQEDEHWAIQEGIISKENAYFLSQNIEISEQNTSWLQLINALDKEQMRSIRSYFEYMRDFFPPITGMSEREALEIFWDKRTGEVFTAGEK